MYILTKIINSLINLPIAELSVLDTFTIISVDDASLNINKGCTGPLLSTTLYDDSLKNTVIATRL